ncbi:MAG: ABC transporter permease [Candidatus Omnitrophica bacterium]|nr:ABC transporter permease [Candidatus Omnitrophota bacterium]
MIETHIYESHRELKLGIKIWLEMFRELFQFRQLIGRLFLRDLSVRYKQSLLGQAWILIMPLVAIGTFMYLNHTGVLRFQETGMPYPLYALMGLSIWQIFATGLNAGANSLVGSGDLITKINFPREVLVLASMGQSVFEFLVKMALIVICFFVFHFCPSWKIIFLPFMLLPLLLLTIGLSLLLSLANGVFRDCANIVSLFLMFVMFLTPVLYPVPLHHFFFKINVLSPLIDVPRQVMAFGHIDHGLLAFQLATCLSVLIFLVSWRIFHLVETKIPERI